MNKQSAAYLFDSHVDADQAIRAISASGFDVKHLSLVGKGYHTEEHPVGFYSVGDRMKFWGGIGAVWGAMWGLLFGPAIFLIPGLGLIALAGPLVTALLGIFEGAVVVGGVSALVAALIQTGIPEDQAIKYETALKMDKYILLAQGSTEELARVGAALAGCPTTEAV